MPSHVPQLDFASHSGPMPRIRYARIPLNNLPSGSYNIQPTSSQLLEWKIPASTPAYLARSYVAFQYTIPAGGAGNYTVVHESDGCDLLRHIYFGNASGLGIVDLQNADAYVSAMRPYRTKLDDFLTFDQLAGFYPSRQKGASNLVPYSLDGLLTGTLNASPLNGTDLQHIRVHPVANQAVTVTRMFPLSSLVDTFLAMDQPSVFGVDFYLRINSQIGQRLGFYTQTPQNPSSLVSLTPITAAVPVSNCILYLAQEANLDIRNSLLASLSKGSIRLNIPYTYSYRFSSSVGASANVSLTLTKNYGRGLKRVALVPFNAAQEFSAGAFDHSNFQGTKIKCLQSSLDARPLTDSLVNSYNPNSSLNPNNQWNQSDSPADDYREIENHIKGSVIQSYPQYQAKYVYMDCWGVPLDCQHASSVQKYEDALSLIDAGDRVWSVQAQTPFTSAAGTNLTQGLILYAFCTFLRTLHIQPDGISMTA